MRANVRAAPNDTYAVDTLLLKDLMLFVITSILIHGNLNQNQNTILNVKPYRTFRIFHVILINDISKQLVWKRVAFFFLMNKLKI